MIEKVLSIKYQVSRLCGLAFCIFISACGGDDEATPRPMGYYRIDLPEKKYLNYDESCPFKFVYPAYATVEPDNNPLAQPCWMNVEYKKFKATLYLSYKPIKNNLDSLLEQSRALSVQQQVKANAMKESPVVNDSAKVYGLVYEFGGNTASSIQFYLTDSTKNFMRGALYFYARPNADSLKPVYEFLRDDVFKMIESFEWKEKH